MPEARRDACAGRSLLLSLLVGAPAFTIAVLGLAHPVFLTPATADRWQLAHLLLLPVFPLVAGSLLYLLRRDSGPLAWVARLSAYAFAVLYTALDAIAGIGAPEQVRNAAAGTSPPIGDLYAVGDRLGRVGVLALALAVALTAALSFRRRRDPVAAAAAVLLLTGCAVFYRHHVFPPKGVLAMVGIGVGLSLLAWLDRRPARP